MRRRMPRPEPLQLFWDIWGGETRSLRSIAREHGVGHSLVRAWCDELGVPYPSGEEQRHIRSLQERLRPRQGLTRNYAGQTRNELEDYLSRLWSEHGCGEFVARYGAAETGAVCIG